MSEISRQPSAFSNQPDPTLRFAPTDGSRLTAETSSGDNSTLAISEDYPGAPGQTRQTRLAGRPGCRFTHHAMACTWGLRIEGEDAGYAAQAAQAAFDEVDRLEQELSRFVEHGEIAQLNALTAGESMRVGVDVIDCLELASRIGAETHGAFDVTAASQLSLGGMGESAGPWANPMHNGSRMSLSRTRKITCPCHPTAVPLVDIHPEARRVTVLQDGVVVDLGGIGKGYAIDRAVAILQDWSIHTALIDAGQSTLYALGAPHGAKCWVVGIRAPKDQSAILGRVRLRNRALSGSGGLLHGRHIIDPRTTSRRAGIDRSVRRLSAWSAAPSAAEADALSTAFMILEPEEVADYCRRSRRAGIAAMLYAEGSSEGELLCYGAELDVLDPQEQ